MTSVGAEQLPGVLLRAASGDEIAFAQLVEAHHGEMRRVSYVICGSTDLADDAVQQAWQIAWRKLGTVRDPTRLRAWLVAVAANESRQLLRRRRRRREIELDPGWHGQNTSERPLDVRLIDLAAALEQLTVEDRQLLAMRYVAGLNASEIAAVAGGTSSRIRSRLSRLLARLREDLDHV